MVLDFKVREVIYREISNLFYFYAILIKKHVA